jgi:hypothetical protein
MARFSRSAGLALALVTVIVGTLAFAISQAREPHGLPTASRSGLLWSADLSAFAPGAKPPFAPVFVDTPFNVFGGGSLTTVSEAGRGTVLRAYGSAHEGENGLQRAEVVPDVAVTAGQVVYVAFDLWVAPRLRVSSAAQGPFQVKSMVASGTEGYPPVGLLVGAHRRDRVLVSDGSLSRTYDLGPVPRGSWSRFTIGMKVSKRPREAWVEVWRDGRNVLRRTNGWHARDVDGRPIGTMTRQGDANYFKFGVYRQSQPFPVEFRYDNLVIFTNE